MTISSKLPAALYHYTSVRGVEGILSKKAIRASLLHFMNDSREWLYPLDLVRQALHKRISIREDQHWIAFLAELVEALNRIQGLNICAFSLTEMPNQLSQWRAYCPPEGGYNLCFDSNLLKQHLDRHGFELRQCLYDSREQQKAIEVVVERVLSSVGKSGNEKAVLTETEKTLQRFISELPAVAPMLKHWDFREEQEWRAFSLVSSNDPRMDYYLRGAVAIPYCSLDLQTASLKFPITQIMVGPNAHQDLAVRGMSALAFKCNVSVNVTKSTTPLRNL